MRLELRKSDENACQHCGATELISTQDGQELVHSLDSLIEDEARRREWLLAIKAAARRKLDLEQHEKNQDDFEKTLRAALGADVPRYRLLKNKQRRKRLELLEQVLAAHKEKTRLV